MLSNSTDRLMPSRATLKFAAVLRALVPCIFLLVVNGARGGSATLPGASNAVVSVNLNSVPKGEFVVWVTADGRYLIKLSDLISMGIIAPTGDPVNIEGESYLVMQTLRKAKVKLDESTQTFDIDSAPDTLGKQVIDLLPHEHPNSIIPQDSSAFLNYRAGFSGGNQSSRAFSLYQELGISRHNYLFLSDGSFITSRGSSTFVRNMSSLTYDRREQFVRETWGDLFTTTGEFGSTLNFGGFSFSKLYSEQPNFVKRPMANFTTNTALPAEATIFLNGLPIRTQKVSPGVFDLRNLNYFGGAQDIQIQVKDGLGQTKIYNYKYYFTDDLLRQGLHEYNYAAGFSRRNFGINSFNYGPFGASFYHRYGFSENFTVGARGEALAGSYNIGPLAVYRIGQAGVVSSSVAFNHSKGQVLDALSGDVAATVGASDGTAMSLHYSYQSGRFIGTAGLLQYSRGYSATTQFTNFTGFDRLDRIEREIDLSVGYGSAKSGSLGVNFSDLRKYQGQNTSFVVVNFTRPIPGKANLFASYSTGTPLAKGSAFFMGIAWYPTIDYSASLSSEKPTRGSATTVLESGSNVPIGEGLGYRVALEHGATLNGVAPTLQYNTRTGSILADVSSQTADGVNTESYNFAYAGSVLKVADQPLGFSRPVTDSFGYVLLDRLENVRVYQNNQEMGRTDASGRVFLPFMGSFVDNQISISDKDIPIDYNIEEVNHFVAPNFRSGSLIKFVATRIQATTGKLRVRLSGIKETVAAEYIEIEMRQGGKVTLLATGRGGEFYAENLAAGDYQAKFSFKNHLCEFRVSVPQSKEMLVDLKELVCEAAP